MDYPREVETERLTLRPASVEDADALFPLFGDPAGWWYDPAGRHADRTRTRRFLARAAERWSEGLSYWTVRERATGRVIGFGGAQRHASGAWNLNYRIATAAQGRGYATELGKAAQAAAAHVDRTVPVIAWVASHNLPSRRVAERLGLTDHGPRLDASDATTRLAYADRPLDGFLALGSPSTRSR